jgi:hypothetical protein
VGTEDDNARLFAQGGDLPIVVGGLYLGPFAGITFLWFVAVIRDQIGERGPVLCHGVPGSAILFVALLFVALCGRNHPGRRRALPGPQRPDRR